MKAAQVKRRVRAVVDEGAPATVSVVILCYNYGHYLRQATDSALDQNGVKVNVIIVDDKSTDDSLHVARGLATAHPGAVTVVENQVNLGLVGTFNVGLAAATGEFIVRIDADDLLTPGALKRAVDVARVFPQVGLIYGHPLHFSGHNLPKPRLRATHWTVWPGVEWLEDRCREGHNVITSPEVMMRRSVVERVGPIQPLKHTNDMEMWCRMSAFSDVAYVHGADQAWHRDHEDSMSAKEVGEILEITERAQAFDVLFNGVASELAVAKSLHRQAKETLAGEALDAASHAFDCGRGDGDLIEGYLRIATLLVDEPERLRAWDRLDRRRKMGSARAGSPLVSVAPRVWRRTASSLRWWRWHRNGVF